MQLTLPSISTRKWKRNAEAELAEQRLADLQTMLDDMAAQRDAWQHQAQATQRLLADATARRPWWKRLTG